jgi:hypothetical protein
MPGAAAAGSDTKAAARADEAERARKLLGDDAA